ncbi:MAG: DUF5666 domain-containing protein [candidate division KSB1 bacterium]|nr:DUF5666 domain-containing protein [candidate division KSB1 bacterium]MDZ7302406.1 DUF5666 domain-containing protein [candidate division KSB1 bacterium]MDZ7311608.1 DUF5666 domain-containing protein [candidate division KSB1 bacterium]
MDKIIGFSDLRVGQRVKIKGKSTEGESFLALEVSVKPDEEGAAMEGRIQRLDMQKNLLRLLNRDLMLTNGVEIKNLLRQPITLKDLKVGDVVKVKGTYSPAKGFLPAKVKMQESKGFNIEEIQGHIQKIDSAKNALEVCGITITLNEKTEIEGF